MCVRVHQHISAAICLYRPENPRQTARASASASSFVGGFGCGQSDTLEARAKLTSDSALELGGLPRLSLSLVLHEEW